HMLYDMYILYSSELCLIVVSYFSKTTIICDYPENKDKSRLKFFCKDTNGICEEILTESSKSSNKRFTLTGTKRDFNISISNVSSDDAGVYWCGLKSNDRRQHVQYFQPSAAGVSLVSFRFCKMCVDCVLIVVFCVVYLAAGLQTVMIVIPCVAVLLLLLLLISFLIYKRKRTAHTTMTLFKLYFQANIYEEIQECLQKPDTGNTTTIIYTTASFPMNPPASLHYSTINFQNSSDKGEARIPRPSSSICEYTTVKSIQSPADSPVVQRSRSTEDPLYTTVNKPQQQQPGGNISPDRKM
uniref:Immunoglobulin V-set domain-containing protein n=1 Tax=Lates calcarifer TaxID=8187 RepID=A0A4W6BNE1_LATCA